MINPLFLLFLLGVTTAGNPLVENLSSHISVDDIKQLKVILNDLYSNNYGDDTIITAVINIYADKLITNIDKFMNFQHFDPMAMPDISEKFKKFLIDVECLLSEGVMTDASTLHREGDCIVSYNKTSEYLTIVTPLAFTELAFQYNYKLKFELVSQSGTVTGSVKDFTMVTVIGIDFKAYNASLNDYEITNSGHISVKFSGHFIYDWMLNILSNMTTFSLKPIILGLVAIIVDDTLVNIISIINDIVQKILNI